jgi:enoyl-CoA hydratase/carnithine racemase
MSAPEAALLLDRDAATGVVTLTLNRPERMNALTLELYDELRRTIRRLGEDPDVRVIVLTGAGRAFCSGGDVHDIIGALVGRDFKGLLEFTRMTCDLVLAIRQCPRPVIAALNGTVAGAGAVIAAAADFRIAASTARIAFLFTRVGLAGADMGAAWLLPRIVGLGRATEILMTGEFVDAHEAHRIGLYNQVVEPDALTEAVRARAAMLARGPAHALAKTKEALTEEAHMSLAAALDAEAQMQAHLMTEPDFREAYEAFRAKRPAKFL